MAVQELLYDVAALDVTRPLFGKEEVYRILPHRFEFEQITGVLLCDPERQMAIGYRTYTPEDFWTRGHIPGLPLLPGVLMVEAAAQVGSWYATYVYPERKGFWALAGVDAVRYRGVVKPGDTVIYVDQVLQLRPRYMKLRFQGISAGKVVVDGEITGMRVEEPTALA